MGDSGCRLSGRGRSVRYVGWVLKYVPAANSDSDTHDHVRIHCPQRLMLSDELTQIHVADDGGVQQQERYFRVDNLHRIQFTQGIAR